MIHYIKTYTSCSDEMVANDYKENSDVKEFMRLPVPLRLTCTFIMFGSVHLICLALDQDYHRCVLWILTLENI